MCCLVFGICNQHSDQVLETFGVICLCCIVGSISGLHIGCGICKLYLTIASVVIDIAIGLHFFERVLFDSLL